MLQHSPDPPVQPWERQPGETPQAFEAFALYRDTEGRRSQHRTAQQLGKSIQLLNTWSSRWSWVDRVAAYDREQDRLYQVEVLRDRHRVAARHVGVARSLLAKGLQRLQTIDVSTLSPMELTQLVKLGLEIEGRAYRLDQVDDGTGLRVVIDNRLVPPSAVIHVEGAAPAPRVIDAD